MKSSNSLKESLLTDDKFFFELSFQSQTVNNMSLLRKESMFNYEKILERKESNTSNLLNRAKNSIFISFDNNLKYQIDNFQNYENHEIFEDDPYYKSKSNKFEDKINENLEKTFEKNNNRFDITNKIINLMILDASFKKYYYFVYLMNIAIRIYLFVYFYLIYSYGYDYSVIYLCLFHSPRFFYILTMTKIYFQPTTDDIFLERIFDGFNIFDNSPQKKWKQDLEYDYKLNIDYGGFIGRNFEKKYNYYEYYEKNFIINWKSTLNSIVKRIFLIIFPVELIYIIMFNLYKEKEKEKGLKKKLIMIAEWIYKSYEIYVLMPSLILLCFNKNITNGLLNLDLNYDTISFLIMAFNAFIYLLLIFFLVITNNEKATKGPVKFFLRF